MEAVKINRIMLVHQLDLSVIAWFNSEYIILHNYSRSTTIFELAVFVMQNLSPLTYQSRKIEGAIVM